MSYHVYAIPQNVHCQVCGHTLVLKTGPHGETLMGDPRPMHVIGWCAEKQCKQYNVPLCINMPILSASVVTDVTKL